MLKELKKNLPDYHIQYKNIEDLVNFTSEIADFINTAKKEAENGQRLYQIQMYFNTKENLNLMEHDRKFIKEGFFEISTNEKKTFHAHLFLFNDSLLLAVRNDNFNHFTSIAFILMPFSILDEEKEESVKFSVTEIIPKEEIKIMR